MQAQCTINRALRDRIALQIAILRVPPGALFPVKLLHARRPARHTYLHALRSTHLHLPAHQEIRPPLIRHQRVPLRIIKNRIGIGSVPNMPVIMKKQAHFARVIRAIMYLYLAQKQRPREVHAIVKDQLHLEIMMH